MDIGRGARLPSNLPTGTVTLLTGLVAFVAVLYLGGRGASPWALGLVAALVGAGVTMLVRGGGVTKEESFRPRVVAIFGILAGLVVLVLHMSITNPGACAVAWAQMLTLGVPWVGGVGAAGSVLLVEFVRRQQKPFPARGGDRALTVALLLAVAASAVAVYPFAHNALLYSPFMTGVSLRLRPVPETQGSAAVAAGEHILVVRPWGGGPVLIDVYDLAAVHTGQISISLPDGVGGLQMALVDTADGTPYASWVQRVPRTDGQPVDLDVWQAVLAKLDAATGKVVRTWVFPAETTSARLGLVHMGQAVVVREGYIACYALPDQGDPVELWRGDVAGTDLMQAAAGTVVVATFGAPAACYELATGQRLWLVDGETAAQPVWDDGNEVWVVVTRDAVVGLKASTEAAVWGFGRDPQVTQGGASTAMPYAGSGRLLIIERPSGPTWDWPPINVRLTIYDTRGGRQLGQAMLERDAFSVISLTENIIWVGATRGLLIGLDMGGGRLFRTWQAGAVSEVVGSLDGGLLLLGQTGLQAATVRR